jgi:integrase
MLPGAHRVVRRKKSGKTYIYIYAWRGRDAPQIGSFSGASLAEAEAKERHGAADVAGAWSAVQKPLANPGFMSGLIADFRAYEIPKMAASTQKVWRGHLDAIEDVFGATSLRAMQRRGSRTLIKRWHEGMGAQARTANYRLTVLVRVLNWGVDEERLDRNPASAIARLDEGPGRAAITWTDDELKRLLLHCKPQVARGVRLALLTGLRLSDVVALNWSEVEADVIRRPTSKSRRKQLASIPLHPALRELLAECPRIGPKVITNSRGRPWKNGDSFDSSLRPALDKTGIDKHFHDLRGNAATEMFRGGVSIRQIGLAMGWSERETENRIHDYVDLDAASRAMAAARSV